MSYDFPDGPDFNPEPLDEPEPTPDPEMRCPDCRVGWIETNVGCGSCGLSWDDLTAADEMLGRFDLGGAFG